MNTTHISFQNSQPVHFLGNLENPKQIWVCCHGYGQTAAEFSEEFKSIQTNDTLLVFPESLSRFYRRGHAGRVVGSWMTRLYRELDIDNQNNYISAVWQHLEDENLIKEEVKRVGFGFSQGGATMARWADQNSEKIDELILWGCRFPPDLKDKHLQNFRDQKVVRSFIGDEDEFFPPDQLEEFRKLFENVKNLDWNIYHGGHKVDVSIIQELMKGD